MREAAARDAPDSGSGRVRGSDRHVEIPAVVAIDRHTDRYPSQGRHRQRGLDAVGRDAPDLAGEREADVNCPVVGDREVLRCLLSRRIERDNRPRAVRHGDGAEQAERGGTRHQQPHGVDSHAARGGV